MSELASRAVVARPDRRRWIGLAVIVTAQFMVVLDVAIVNVALPSIKTDLDFSQESLQWVVTAYSILFGGVLLLGGRAAGRRAHEPVQMVVDLLHQRPRGRRRARAHAAARQREPRRARRPALRPAGRCFDHRWADAARVCDDARRAARLGHRRDD